MVELGSSDVRLFVVPGICASQLEDVTGGNDLVWIDPIGLALDDDFLALGRTHTDERDSTPGVRLEATGLLPLLYDKLIAALAAAFDAPVDVFPYDWRRGLPSSGRAFAGQLRAALGRNPGVRIAIVAHSMGGLVATAALAQLSPDERARVVGLCTLGTPWRGSFEAVLGLALAGPLADGFTPFLRLDAESVREVIQSFRGLLHLIPPGRPALADPALYAPGPLATSPALRAAFAEIETLPRQPPPGTVAIASDFFPTVNHVAGGARELSWDRGAGDGIVPWDSATAAGAIACERVNAYHPAMPLYPSVIRKTIGVLSTWLGSPRLATPATAMSEDDLPTPLALPLRGPLGLVSRMPFITPFPLP